MRFLNSIDLAEVRLEIAHEHVGRQIRRYGKLDSTLGLFMDPYRFIGHESRRLGTDVFRSRHLLRPTVFMIGPAATELFSDPERFHRVAPPLPEALMEKLREPSRVEALVSEVRSQLRQAAPRWVARGEIRFYDELQSVMTRAVCRWIGLPVRRNDIGRTKCLSNKHAIEWITYQVQRERMMSGEPTSKNPIEVIVWHKDQNGNMLSTEEAIREVLGLLRSLIEISTMVTFAALALQRHPESALRILRDQSGTYINAFVEEVRRFYPCTPAWIARTVSDFEWGGVQFKKGDRAVLDIYGTNHDEREWSQPQIFRPERFANQTEFKTRFDVEITKVAVKFLVTHILYDVLPQSLDVEWRKTPAIPADHMTLSHLQLIAEGAALVGT